MYRSFFVLVITLFFIGSAIPADASTCMPPINPFSVVNTSFPQTPAGIGAGAQNVPLIVTLAYTGGCFVSYAQFLLGISSPFSAPGGGTSESQYQVNLQPYTIFQITYTINIQPQAKTGTYNLPLSIYYTPSNSSQFVQNTTLPIYLLGSVYLNLSTSGEDYALEAGQVNNVTFVIENSGSGNATQVSLALAQPLQGLSILNQFPKFDSIPAGANYSFSMSIYASSTAAGSAVTLPITVSYENSYGEQNQQEFQVGFYVQNSLQSSPLSLSVVTPQVTVAGSSELRILITNNGNYSIYSPSFVLTAPAGFAITSNSSYSDQQGVIQPGQSFELDSIISTGPKIAEGAYTATLTISYTDSSGEQRTVSIPLGFVVVGSIQLNLQGVTIASSEGTATVSGTLLNEGSTSAYYLEMFANISRDGNLIGEGNTYVGEVDPNTPVPFSISFSLPPEVSNGTVSISLKALYENDYGTTFTSSFQAQNYQLAVYSASSNISKVHTRGSLFLLATVALLLIIIVALVITILMHRGRRKDKDEKVV